MLCRAEINNNCACVKEDNRNLWVNSADDWAPTEKGQGGQERALHIRVVPRSSPSSFTFSLALGNTTREDTTVQQEEQPRPGFQCAMNVQGEMLYLFEEESYESRN